MVCHTGLQTTREQGQDGTEVPNWSWWWTEELSETCRVSFQNKFEKLMRLVGFIIRNLSRCTVTWTSHYSITMLLNLFYLKESYKSYRTYWENPSCPQYAKYRIKYSICLTFMFIACKKKSTASLKLADNLIVSPDTSTLSGELYWLTGL